MKFLVFCSFVLGLQAAYVQAQGVLIQAEFTSPSNYAVVFTNKKSLILNCNVNISVAYNSLNVEWKKDRVLINEVASLKDRFTVTNPSNLRYTLTVNNAEYQDAGNWSCGAVVDGETKSEAQIRVGSTVDVKIKTENINVVEEEKLRIECSVLGNPFPVLTWSVDSSNYNSSSFDERVIIQDYKDENGNTVEQGVLIIEKVNKNDRGIYSCIGTNSYWEQDRHVTNSTIRVKDKYAALWPFLGICIEVVVLCAIIIIYEKKRNKTELEESDTDQSPDQKNTPDHGKEANLRHRQ